MKLVNKISRYFLLNSIVIFIVLGGLLYFLIEQTIITEADEQLDHIHKKIVKELNNGNVGSFPPLIEIKEIQKENPETGYNDSPVKSSVIIKREPYRQYTSSVNIDGKLYKIILRISLIEKEDMLFTIIGVTIGALLLFLLSMFLITKYSSQKVFKDFYNTLAKLENFTLSQNDVLELNKSKIEEFDKLNKSVYQLSKKARNEYRSLREFTEETNHEVQTPVAVTISKLEILLQSKNLNEDDLNLINIALNNLNKLERINKSILLLNKLDHKNLFDDSKVNIAHELNIILSSFSESVAAKNIVIKFSLDEKKTLSINPALLNILLSNLMSNAVRHNIEGGEIHIQLQDKQLIVSNNVSLISKNTEKFFDRFYKESGSTESVGLGLTIVKKICDLYGIEIRSGIQNKSYTIALNYNKIMNDK